MNRSELFCDCDLSNLDVQILCNMSEPCSTKLFLLVSSFACFIVFVPFVVSLQFFPLAFSVPPSSACGLGIS